MKSHKINVCSGLHSMKYHEFQIISGYFRIFHDLSLERTRRGIANWVVRCREMSGVEPQLQLATATVTGWWWHSMALKVTGHTATRPHWAIWAIWAILCHAYDYEIIWNHAVANQTKIYKDQTTPSLKPINTYYNTSENSGHLYVTMFMSFSVLFSMPITMRLRKRCLCLWHGPSSSQFSARPAEWQNINNARKALDKNRRMRWRMQRRMQHDALDLAPCGSCGT